MEKISISFITEERIPEVVAFFHECLKDVFSATFTAQAIKKYRDDYDAERLKAQIQKENCVHLLASHENKVIGILFGRPVNGGVAAIEWLVVDPNFQGIKIGKQLLYRTFLEYKKVGAHKVVVYTETKGAKDFYENCNMKLEGIHPKHWWGILHYCLSMDLHLFEEDSDV